MSSRQESFFKNANLWPVDRAYYISADLRERQRLAHKTRRRALKVRRWHRQRAKKGLSPRKYPKKKKIRKEKRPIEEESSDDDDEEEELEEEDELDEAERLKNSPVVGMTSSSRRQETGD